VQYKDITEFIDIDSEGRYAPTIPLNELGIDWYLVHTDIFNIPTGLYTLDDCGIITLRKNDTFGMATIKFIGHDMNGAGDNVISIIKNICYYDGVFVPVILSREFIEVNDSIFKSIKKI